MFRKSKFAIITALISLMTAAVSAQVSVDVGIKDTFAGGDVTAVSEGKISLTTKDGPIEVEVLPATSFKRVPADNPSLKAAVGSAISEIGVGDKLLVSGLVSPDRKLISAKTVYLMTKSSIAEKLSKEDADWRARGMVGKVVSIDPMTNAISVTVRAGMMAPPRTVVVKSGEKTVFKRYAPDSVDFAKALPSTVGEIKKDDEIRFLGNKNADGSEVEAEIVVSASFKQSAGTIKSIDVARNEIVITDAATKKDVTIAVLPSSMLKTYPEEIANRLAMAQRMQAAGQAGFRPPTQGGQTPPAGGGQTPGTGQGSGVGPGQGQGMGTGGQGGGMRGGFDESRLPSITINDLKVGDVIGVLSSRTQDASKSRAIKLFSGVKPFLDAQQAIASMGGGQRGGGGVGGGFTIPGLDGFGN